MPFRVVFAYQWACLNLFSTEPANISCEHKFRTTRSIDSLPGFYEAAAFRRKTCAEKVFDKLCIERHRWGHHSMPVIYGASSCGPLLSHWLAMFPESAADRWASTRSDNVERRLSVSATLPRCCPNGSYVVAHLLRERPSRARLPPWSVATNTPRLHGWSDYSSCISSAMLRGEAHGGKHRRVRLMFPRPGLNLSYQASVPLCSGRTYLDRRM